LARFVDHVRFRGAGARLEHFEVEPRAFAVRIDCQSALEAGDVSSRKRRFDDIEYRKAVDCLGT
jgi:hypothetical protein